MITSYLDPKLMFKKTLLLLFFNVFVYGQEQLLSPQAEISMITAGPGSALYEAFGHSTIRVKDVRLGIDMAYNYGIFDFDAPNFYLNFTKGKLLYKVLKYPFHYFVRSYHEEKRWVKEQVLNLSQEEKQLFFDFLEKNCLPENASYLYDPFFDNCATKLRDITQQVLEDKVEFYSDHLTEKLSIRTLMNREFHWNSWGSFGINFALGSQLDKVASPLEYMYLPDYVHKAFQNATITKNKITTPLVLEESQLLRYPEKQIKIQWYNPFFVFSLRLDGEILYVAMGRLYHSGQIISGPLVVRLQAKWCRSSSS